jgi:hypothetical protein
VLGKQEKNSFLAAAGQRAAQRSALKPDDKLSISGPEKIGTD